MKPHECYFPKMKRTTIVIRVNITITIQLGYPWISKLNNLPTFTLSDRRASTELGLGSCIMQKI